MLSTALTFSRFLWLLFFCYNSFLIIDSLLQLIYNSYCKILYIYIRFPRATNRRSSMETYLKIMQLDLYLKAPKHECIFSKSNWNLNFSEIFWACNTSNNFHIIFPKYKKPHSLRSSKFKISRFKSNQFDLKL